MLELTLNTTDEIKIGETIKIAILGVGDNTARLGIQAPRNIRVDRAEVHERRQRTQGNGRSPPPNGRGNRR